ncbi:universal stress protein [Gammaproteobacteria bacterium]|nr:universal stress protein [Gammaproteobacteria bacterium]
MYKTILCAIEASQEGKMVLAKASELANLCGAKLVVIHVLPYKLLSSDYQKTLKEDIAPKIEKLLLPLVSARRTVTLRWASHTRLFAEKQRSARPIW